MQQRPPHVADEAVLAAVQQHWDATVDAVEHLPVGFGAHHWRASRSGEPTLFVSLDGLGRRHDLARLRTAYAGAAALAATGLEFVHAGLPPYAVPLGPDALSATPWVDGVNPDAIDPATTRDLLARLHATPPPVVDRWQPLVSPGFGAELAELLRTPWTLGPYGERAHAAVVARLSGIEAWVERYHRRAGESVEHPWVATHGEPHRANQLRTDRGTLLVDWETLKLAPAERDLREVGDGDPAMLEMFDLEWRLDEISQYAVWFAAPHTGTLDDATAFADLLTELDRPDWTTPTPATAGHRPAPVPPPTDPEPGSRR